MRVRAFRALRPPAELANSVGCVAYDTVDTEEARELVNGNPHSFLHITRPDVDLPESTDVHSDAAYAQASLTLSRFRDEGRLITEENECLYIYRIDGSGHSQTGIVGCCNVEDYNADVIKRHEKTRPDKEVDRTRLTIELRAHTGPVLMTYRANREVDDIVAVCSSRKVLLEASSEDGTMHRVWRVDEPDALTNAFLNVTTCYIADGHHRAAAASGAARTISKGKNSREGEAEFHWFLAALFPENQLQIMSYNRCVKDFANQTCESFIEALKKVCEVSSVADAVPSQRGRISCYVKGKWIGLTFPIPTSIDPVEGLDVSQLQDNVLGPLLGIDDPRTNSRIEFVGGIRGTAELEKRVNAGSAAVAFSLYPVSVTEMMDIADAGKIMPPKSTWFEPKLRSGLLVHAW